MGKPTYDELLEYCNSLKQELHSFGETREKLQQSELQLKRLFNNLPGMVYRCSLAANLHPTLIFVSRGSQELFDVPPEFFTEQQTNVMETLAHPDDLPDLKEEQNSAISEHRPYKLLYRVCLDDDHIKWVWDQGECVYAQNGTPLYLEGIMVDVSNQKMREFELLQENKRLQGAISGDTRFGSLIGKSEGMRKVFEFIMKAAERDANVIIFGETGVGKDLVARSIHEHSGCTGPYIPVNCGAIPENLMESEFFGHKKGAFSGATSDSQGYLAAAHGGTLFLDEIGEITPALQVKLLRVLESKRYTPLGGNEPRASSFRLIAATNKDLHELVKCGEMRSDFFYRLHVLPIHIPPLRERLEDIPLLVQEFMARSLGRDSHIPELPGHLKNALARHIWPGNVRELQNVLERYLAFGEVVFSDIGQESSAAQGLDALLQLPRECSTLNAAIDTVERFLLLQVLEKNKWKKGCSARELGLTMRTLQRKLKHHGI